MSFWKFWQFYPMDCPKMLEWSWNFMKIWNLIRYIITYDNEHYCNKFGSLGSPQKSHFFQPSSKKVNFHWRFICWRSRHRKNLIANFYDAVNSRFRIYKLLVFFFKKNKKVLRFEHMVEKRAASRLFFPNLIIYNRRD